MCCVLPTVLGCGASRAPEGRPAGDSAALAPATLLPPAVSLAGTWHTGTGAEPIVDSVVLRPPCLVLPAVWLIEQEGNVLRAWWFPEQYSQGIRSPAGVGRETPARGTISGIDVVLDDGTYRYVLRYDSASTHLRGTRSGRQFWAVRQRVERTESCLPPP